MTRVVADTNILVSALQFGGKPKQLLDLAIDGQVDLALSEALIAETLSVSATNSIARPTGWRKPIDSSASSLASSCPLRASG